MVEEVVDIQIRVVDERHEVMAMDLKGPVVNYPRLRHEYYEVVFVEEEVLEVQALLLGEFVLDELVMVMNL
ncbi:hypothetical protein Tco_1124458 [Tanacetum coccineum]|uniref:Uncharacterized protein n=1 Tax=Tanacetum coccineum TaxID=301880 RepID=A0ABQ5J983_9ASTR